ncbi:MAG: Hsp33 family molecular chaperone HslO [Roseinatronobacter sp.]
MSLGSQIAWDDTILPFQLDSTDLRGRVVRLDTALERVLANHAYPPVIEDLVAEAALLTAMIGQTIKLRWKLSLQIRGNGAVKLIATDYYAPESDGAPARIRAYSSFNAETLDHGAPGFEQMGEGYFAILIDQGPDMVPYQGITPLQGGSLAGAAAAYFDQSEQLPTRFAVGFGRTTLNGQGKRWRAGGVMLQQLPLSEGQNRATLDEDWTRANLLLDTVEQDELMGPDVQPPDLLLRLFHEEGPRVFDPQAVHFGCSCSEDKVRNTLSIYSAKDIRTMTTPEGTVTADCQFCGAHYVMDPATLGFEAQGNARPA